MSMGCANCNSATSTSIISSSIVMGAGIEYVSSTSDSVEQIRPSIQSLDERNDEDIYHYAKSIQFQVVDILKCILNALDGTTRQQKAPCLVHNMYITLSTSYGAFDKIFIDKIQRRLVGMHHFFNAICKITLFNNQRSGKHSQICIGSIRSRRFQ